MSRRRIRTTSRHHARTKGAPVEPSSPTQPPSPEPAHIRSPEFPGVARCGAVITGPAHGSTVEALTASKMLPFSNVLARICDDCLSAAL